MSRGQSYLITLIRNRARQNQIRPLTLESSSLEDSESNSDELLHKTEMAKTVSAIIRERRRWQQTLLSDFPSFNFADPLFFRELLTLQNSNVMYSLWFFRWLCSSFDYKPDPVSLNLFFGALLDAKAVKAAKCFLDSTGFAWELHQEMADYSEFDVVRIQCLIRALCEGGEVSQAYEFLKKVLKQGLDPGHAVYAQFISGFCKIGNFACMSEILHTMIAWNHLPSVYTYQEEVIKGLCRNEKQHEAFCVFNTLKERDYAPDRVVYTTMIHGLCEMGWFGSARKLWFEMIVEKGMRPNEFTYNVMMHAYLKRGEVVLAKELYSEMVRNGYGENNGQLQYDDHGVVLVWGADQAFEFFERMSGTGVAYKNWQHRSISTQIVDVQNLIITSSTRHVTLNIWKADN